MKSAAVERHGPCGGRPDLRRLERHEPRPRRLKSGALHWALIPTLVLGAFSGSVASSPSEPLAHVNGQSITAEELERTLGVRLSQLQEQIYELKRRELDALIAQRLLTQEAVRPGTSVTALLDAEVKAMTVADERDLDRTRRLVAAHESHYHDNCWEKK